MLRRPLRHQKSRKSRALRGRVILRVVMMTMTMTRVNRLSSGLLINEKKFFFFQVLSFF